MDLEFDPQKLQATTDKLGSNLSSVMELSLALGSDSLSGAYSAIPQLQTLAISHGIVLSGGFGSGYTTLKSFSEQIRWAQHDLFVTGFSLHHQNMFVAKGVDVADEGGVVGGETVSFPARPETNYGPFSFNMLHSPITGTLEQLQLAFAATNEALVEATAEAWLRLAKGLSGITAKLSGVSTSVQNDHKGLPFEMAATRVKELAEQGEIFAANSRAMAGYVRNINVIKRMHQPQVAGALAQARLIPEPTERMLFEAASIARINASLSNAMAMAKPPFNNLMERHDSAGHGSSAAELGMDDIAKQNKSSVATIKSAAGNAAMSTGASGSSATLGAVQKQVNDTAIIGADYLNTNVTPAATMNPGTIAATHSLPGFQATNPMALQAGGAGAASGLPAGVGPFSTFNSGKYNGTAQSASAGGTGYASNIKPSANVLPAWNTTGTGSSGMGSSQSGKYSANGYQNSTGFAGLPGGRNGGSVSGNGIFSGSKQLGAGVPGGTGSKFAAPGFGGPGVGSPGLGGSGRGGSGVGSPGLGGSGLKGSNGALSGLGNSYSGKAPGYLTNGGMTNAGESGVGFGKTGSSTANNAAAGRATGPMMCGQPAARNQEKQSRVRSVVTEVERDANLRALVGERPMVVPGTIGDWARDPVQ